MARPFASPRACSVRKGRIESKGYLGCGPEWEIRDARLLLIRCHDIRHRALELLCGGALAHDAAKSRVARHFGIAKAPGHAAFGIKPYQPLRTLADPAQNIGARIEIVAAGVAEHDHGGLRRDGAHPFVLEIGERAAVIGRAEADL